jgi:DNA-binding transcriptional MerR regulator
MSAYTIGAAAERSGFTTSSLRYYEGIGLVVPAGRTEAGYRLYDDHSLARLAFIARAKQLGCTLEEITDLIGIWDGDRCGPVQRSFHDLVTTKLAAAERQIAELTALAEQQRYTAAQLAGPPVDGPCNEDCACLRPSPEDRLVDGATSGAAAATTTIPIYDATAPITCTAAGNEVSGRIEQIERMRSNLDRIERTEHGMLLYFPDRPDLEAELRGFTVDEKGCCQFWGFDITTTPGELILRWDAPSKLGDYLSRLVTFFEGDEALAADSGLL